MNARQENKLSMYYRVSTFFAHNMAPLAAQVPALPTQVALFTTALDELGNAEMQATEVIKGYAQQKKMYKDNLCTMAISIAGALKALATVTNDGLVLRRATITRSQLANTPATDMYFTCRILGEEAADHAAELLPYGITPALLADYQTVLTNYENSIDTTTTARDQSRRAGQRVDLAMLELDTLLLTLDALMDTQQSALPLLYNQYKLNRKIHQTATATTKPTATLTLAPGELKQALALPYIAGRTYKAKNKGPHNILWCLSQSATAFTHPPKTIPAHTESVLQSAILAPTGIYLLLHNIGAAAVEVEIRVV
ncbi:MAG: hypothetical protein V4613_02910 [Bacteroidota bacterium]